MVYTTVRICSMKSYSCKMLKFSPLSSTVCKLQVRMPNLVDASLCDFLHFYMRLLVVAAITVLY